MERSRFVFPTGTIGHAGYGVEGRLCASPVLAKGIAQIESNFPTVVVFPPAACYLPSRFRKAGSRVTHTVIDGKSSYGSIRLY